jgi:hypothetical protein
LIIASDVDPSRETIFDVVSVDVIAVRAPNSRVFRLGDLDLEPQWFGGGSSVLINQSECAILITAFVGEELNDNIRSCREPRGKLRACDASFDGLIRRW